MVEHAVPEPDVEEWGFSVQQWLDFDGAGDLCVELVDGALVVNPAPTFLHQQVVVRLLLSLAEPLANAGFTLETTGGGIVLPEMLPSQGLIPDLLAVPSDLDAIEKRVLDGADPVLAVEVLSPSSRVRDRVDKMRIYAEMRIPHYWIVDPKAPVTITTHTLDDGAYRQQSSASGDEQLVVDQPFEVTLTPSALARKRDA